VSFRTAWGLTSFMSLSLREAEKVASSLDSPSLRMPLV